MKDAQSCPKCDNKHPAIEWLSGTIIGMLCPKCGRKFKMTEDGEWREVK